MSCYIGSANRFSIRVSMSLDEESYWSVRQMYLRLAGRLQYGPHKKLQILTLKLLDEESYWYVR